MTPERSASTPDRISPGLAVSALALDAGFVTLFAALGRSEHDRAATLAGLFETAWPFLAGLLIAWLVAFIWRNPLSVARAGIPTWIGAVALGALCLSLVGWRTVGAIIRRARRTR